MHFSHLPKKSPKSLATFGRNFAATTFQKYLAPNWVTLIETGSDLMPSQQRNKKIHQNKTRGSKKDKLTNIFRV